MRRRQRKQFLVIGLGRFGSSLAVGLARLGHDVIGVDTDMEQLEALKDELGEVQQLDATNVRALAEVAVPDCDVCVVGRGEDLGDSINITMNLRDLGARYIVAKAVTEQHARILKQLGADQVIFPERDTGERLAHTLASPMITEFFEVTPDAALYTIDAPVVTHNKSLGELQLRPIWGINVLGIYHAGRFNPSPGADTIIAADDRLVVFGSEKSIEEFLGQ